MVFFVSRGDMNAFLIGAIVGLVIGYYFGNKKFRHNVNRMISSMRNKQDELYDEEED